MTCGIYILRFNTTNKVYIGQSGNIELRFKQHINKLNNGLASKTLQEAYQKYGKPTFDILLECSIEELDIEETNAIELFDSVNNGFNTLSIAGECPTFHGEEHGSSKYSNEQIIDSFNFIVHTPELSVSEISEFTGVSISIINQIRTGACHTWLHDRFPKEYECMIAAKGTRCGQHITVKRKGIIDPNIISPEGTSYKVESINGFAREYGLNARNLCQVLKGNKKSVSGWKLTS